jgi:hypothetical protein
MRNDHHNSHKTRNNKLDRTEHSLGSRTYQESMTTTTSLESIDDDDEFFSSSDDEFAFDDYLSCDGDSYIFSSTESINSSSVGH